MSNFICNRLQQFQIVGDNFDDRRFLSIDIFCRSTLFDSDNQYFCLSVGGCVPDMYCVKERNKLLLPARNVMDTSNKGMQCFAIVFIDKASEVLRVFFELVSASKFLN